MIVYIFGILSIITGIFIFYFSGEILYQSYKRNPLKKRMEKVDYFLGKLQIFVMELFISLVFIIFTVALSFGIMLAGIWTMIYYPALNKSNQIKNEMPEITNENDVRKNTTEFLIMPVVKQNIYIFSKPNFKSKKLAPLKKGDIVITYLSIIKKNNFTPVIKIESDKDDIKGWIPYNYLRDSHKSERLKQLRLYLQMQIKFSNIKKSIKDGVIGFVFALVLSFFSYHIRKNLLWLAAIFSIVAIIIDYSYSYGNGLYCLPPHFMMPQILMAIAVSSLLAKIFSIIFKKTIDVNGLYVD